MAFFLKEDFHQFMPTLITPLLADARLSIDIKMESALLQSADKGEGELAFNIKVKGFEGDQKITMNTSALESKLGALGQFVR